MQVTKNITLDLLETGSPVIIKAKQNDRNTRYITAHLYVDGLAYPVPNGTEIAFRYKKPDGTAGFYDALPDNSPAITVSGNTVTVELVEQVLTVAGCVHCEINMYNAASEKLTTFTFEISVEESVLTDAEIISSDYYNLLTSEIAKALQSVTDATEQAENAAQSAQDAADSAAMSKDWAAGQPITYSGTPVSIAYAGAQRIASITAYGETPQGGTTEAPVALTGISSVTVNDDVTELPIPRPLRRVGYVKDKCVTRVKSVYDKRIVLDGTEYWFISKGVFFYKSAVTDNALTMAACDRYKFHITDNGVSGVTTDKTFAFNIATPERIMIRDDDYTSIEEFKAHLTDNPLTVYYQSTAYDGTNGLDVCLMKYQTGYIESYADESITTAWISSTGALSTGVEVAYVLSSPETYATDPLDIDNASGPLTVMTGGEVEVRMTELVGSRSPELTAKMDKAVYTQVGNPSELDNDNFLHCVNQRNVSGTISAAGYFIDRWKLISGTVQITENGLVLNGTMSQILENAAGTDVTASASAGAASYDNSTKTFTLTATGQTVTWAKLEKGSVATPYVPKGYGAELAECQRYFKRVGNRGFRGWATNETNVVCCLTLATQMRVKPTITPVGTLTAYDEVSSVTVTMDSSTGSTVDTARITAHGTGLTAFRPYSLLGNVDISADL